MRLIVLRHAKSSWRHSLSDFERPLNKRGRKSAKAIGRWLAMKGFVPQSTVCSPSTRTRQTLEILGRQLPWKGKESFPPQLYHGSAVDLLRALVEEEDSPVLLVGHNPSVSHFSQQMLAHRPEHPDFYRFPTASTVVMEFDCSRWRDIYPQSGILLDFVIPRELLRKGG